MRRVLAIGVFVGLCGCAQRPVAVSSSSQPIGKIVGLHTTTCPPEPDGSRVRTDQDAARFVTRLAQAGRECRNNLAATSEILTNEK
jgi:hypothetical protein